MKNVNEMAWCNVDGTSILIIGNKYKGSPLIMWKYDLLICSLETYTRYENELMAEHNLKSGWRPSVKFI